MAWMATAIGGSALLGAAASEAAAEKQLQGTREGIASTERMFNLTNQQQAPYRGAGYTALSEIASGVHVISPDIFSPNALAASVFKPAPAAKFAVSSAS